MSAQIQFSKDSLCVIKRDGTTVPFNASKIVIAIEKAMHSSTGVYVPLMAEAIADDIEKFATLRDQPMTIYEIEDKVYYELIRHNNPSTAKAYEGYKSVQSFKRQLNTTDGSILDLISNKNDLVAKENSNKNAKLSSTQRDLIAGEVSKDITRRMLIPADILQAHDDGAIHIHDMDYYIQHIFNCCLINLEDMFKNGTIINGKKIDTPKSFQVACTVMTQIIAQVASSQFGGQSINGVDRILAPYVRCSYEKYYDIALQEQQEIYQMPIDEEKASEVAWARTRKEVKDGVQTIQYQINTLMTTNGQSPFVTLFMFFEPDDAYAKEAAMITEEILKQRLEGVKNEKDVYITPAFPKLVYVLDEHNIHEDAPYYYLTELAAKCTAKRMYPDYISAKRMRDVYEGNVYSPMGCRSFLSPWKNEKGEYQFDGRFNMGVVSLNLPQIGLIAMHSRQEDREKVFFDLLDKRLDICKEALLIKYKLLKGTTSDVSPIHWQNGCIARLEKGETIDKLLTGGYATISLGYVGLYEATLAVIGESHTAPKGQAFALKVMNYLKKTVDTWKKETNLGFAFYGTPAESTVYTFCRKDRAIFGKVPQITDKEYYTNSYHVFVGEEIDAFSKFDFEAQFQNISTGGCISYVEIPNMQNNLSAILTMMTYIYDHITYAEFNTKSDYCHQCGFDGEIVVNEEGHWECPQCHNQDEEAMTVVRRTCGYLGENYWNRGKTKEISERVLHI